MKKIVENVELIDKLSIYVSSGLKLIRGILHKFFFKKSKGMVFIGRGASIYNHRHIEIGKNVKFEAFSEVQGLSKNGIVFGDSVTIGRFASIRPSSYYGVEIGEGIKIGSNSSVGPYSYLGCGGQIIIGSNVMIGPRCSFFAENHNFENKSIEIKNQGLVRKGIVIEDDCWIGSNVVVLDGVRIGKGSVIAAGTLVSKNVSKNSIVRDIRNKKYEER